MKKIREYLKGIARWLWQFPQNICGVIWKLVIREKVLNKVEHAFAPYNYNRIYLTSIKGGVTLGDYIFIESYLMIDIYVLAHEYGHYRQSLILGPLYLIVIGVPSLLHNIAHYIGNRIGIRWDYYSFYTESWADKLAGITRKSIDKT